jgi:hypothetical protein
VEISPHPLGGEIPEKYPHYRKPKYGSRFDADKDVHQITEEVNNQQCDSETISPPFTRKETEGSCATDKH